jgi:hypothetical protein
LAIYVQDLLLIRERPTKGAFGELVAECNQLHFAVWRVVSDLGQLA